MKIDILQQRWVRWLAVLLAAGWFCPVGFAEPGGVHDNDHGQREEAQGRSQPMRSAAAYGHEEQARRNREWRAEHGREHELHGARRSEFGREEHEHRHLSVERHHWGHFWYGYQPSVFVHILPPGYVPIYVGSAPYYYDQGVFYAPTPLGYAVVPPPLGAIVPALPPGAQAMPAGSVVYYYGDGAFYLPQPPGFVVVTPPLGITVTTLPVGAVPVFINGVQYYQADGVYFLPVMQGGVAVYKTVQP